MIFFFFCHGNTTKCRRLLESLAQNRVKKTPQNSKNKSDKTSDHGDFGEHGGGAVNEADGSSRRIQTARRLKETLKGKCFSFTFGNTPIFQHVRR